MKNKTLLPPPSLRKQEKPAGFLSRMLADGSLYPVEEAVYRLPKVECLRPDPEDLSEEVGRGSLRGKRPGRKVSYKTLSTLAERVLDHLNIEGNDYTRKSPKDCQWEISKKGIPYPLTKTMHWKAIKNKRGLTAAQMVWMIRGKDRAMVRGFTSTQLLTLDVDAHGLKTGSHESCVAIVEEILGLIPDLRHALYTEMTPNGYHVSMILDRPVSAKRAAKMAQDWALAVKAKCQISRRSKVQVESFPKSNGKTGYGCALPLGAGQRVVGEDDLLKSRYQRRVDDARHFLSLPKIKPSTVEMMLEGLMKKSAEFRLADAWEGDILSPRGDTDGQLYKSDFVLEWIRIFEDGIANDESWHAVRVMVAGCRYAGLSERETKSFMRIFLWREDHLATHCQSERGKKALMRVVTCQLNRFRSGLTVPNASSGRPMCYRNGLKSDELREMLYGTLGISVRSEEVRPSRILRSDRIAA